MKSHKIGVLHDENEMCIGCYFCSFVVVWNRLYDDNDSENNTESEEDAESENGEVTEEGEEEYETEEIEYEGGATGEGLQFDGAYASGK
mgnify:CR=1 FL=1